MTLGQYIDAALRTESPKRPLVHADWTRLLHAVLGLTSESFELLDEYKTNRLTNKDKILGETGDLWWFMALVMKVVLDQGYTESDLWIGMSAKFQMMEDEIEFDDIEEAIREFQIDIEPLVTAVKAKCFYSKEPEITELNEIIQLAIWALCELTVSVMQEFDIESVDVIWESNIAKLRARFPEKFTEHDALNRDTEKEFEAINDSVDN